MKHFLDLNLVPNKTLHQLVEKGIELKQARANQPKGAADKAKPLAGISLGMIFEKSSTRTRLSFDIAMHQLGGRTLVLDSAVAHLSRGESIEDTAQVLSTYVDGAMIRTEDHQRLLAFSKAASIPVINGLSDFSHPCQIIAALITIKEHCNTLDGLKIAWVGDSNNVMRSWVHSAAAFNFTLALACPEHEEASKQTLAEAKDKGAKITLCSPEEAADQADIITTDCWVSLNDDPKLAKQKRAALAPYQVNEALMAKAKPNAYFMHCLPLYRGEEVEAAVAEGTRSLIFQEAENRIYAQKAILLWVFNQL